MIVKEGVRYNLNTIDLSKGRGNNMGNRYGEVSCKYGIGSYQQEIHDAFEWIKGNTDTDMSNKKEQLLFLHQNILHLLNGEKEALNPFVKEWGIERGLSYQEILKALGEMYQVMTEKDFKIE